MIECPYCGMENAYCDGVEYVCPDCGNTWDCPEIPRHSNSYYDDDDDDDDDDFDCEIYVNGRKQD